MADDSKKQQADAQFRKVQRAEDGKKAMAEYEASVAAVRAKTEKLKQLRLARDAAEKIAAPVAPAPAKKGVAKKGVAKKGAKKAKRPAGSLANWLDDQEAGGRNT